MNDDTREGRKSSSLLKSFSCHHLLHQALIVTELFSDHALSITANRRFLYISQARGSFPWVRSFGFVLLLALLAAWVAGRQLIFHIHSSPFPYRIAMSDSSSLTSLSSLCLAVIKSSSYDAYRTPCSLIYLPSDQVEYLIQHTEARWNKPGFLSQFIGSNVDSLSIRCMDFETLSVDLLLSHGILGDILFPYLTRLTLRNNGRLSSYGMACLAPL